MKHWILGTVAAVGLASAIVCGAAEEKKPADTAAPAVERPNRGGGPGGRGGGPAQQAERIKMLTERLGLSEDQVAKLKPLLAEEAKKVQELRQDTTLQPEDRRAKMTKIRQEGQKKIKDAKILTADQEKKWEELQAEQRQRQGGQGRGNGNSGSGGGGGGGQRPSTGTAGSSNAPK